MTAEDLKSNGNIGWGWINKKDKSGTKAEKGSLQELAFAFLGIKGGSSICKFVQHLATHDAPASMRAIFPASQAKKVRKFAAMHVEQGHIQLTKKGQSFFYAMPASAREFCEEQRKHPSAETIARRQSFESGRSEYADRKKRKGKTPSKKEAKKQKVV